VRIMISSNNNNNNNNNNPNNNNNDDKKYSHQFRCNICGKGFEQKSRIDKHMLTSHPKPTPSAADVEKILGGIKYPKEKKDLVNHAKDKVSHNNSDNQELMDLIENLPEGKYRDSAELAKALDDLKSGKKTVTKANSEYEEQPGKKGGRTASTYSLSAASCQHSKISFGNRLAQKQKRVDRICQR
jgi:hypothetical protein